jgi:thiol-disulfide isomerase/thioredoxin
MRKFITLLLLFVSIKAFSQEIKTIGNQDLSQLLASKNDTIYVINFWATWCKPCIEELPAFENIYQEFKTQKVKVILVSNDFKKQVEPKLKPFVKEKKISSEVWWMSETDPNVWVNLVEPMWEGSLPATLIFRGSDQKRFFQEGQLTEQTIKTIINTFKP